MKIAICLSILAISLTACTTKEQINTSKATQDVSTNLPFVGERYFNFESSACTQQKITITKTGDTTVEFIGCDKPVVLYQGAYQSSLPTNWGDDIDKGFYLIKNNTIYALDHKGQALEGCAGIENKPCASGLFE